MAPGLICHCHGIHFHGCQQSCYITSYGFSIGWCQRTTALHSLSKSWHHAFLNRWLNSSASRVLYLIFAVAPYVDQPDAEPKLRYNTSFLQDLRWCQLVFAFTTCASTSYVIEHEYVWKLNLFVCPPRKDLLRPLPRLATAWKACFASVIASSTN